MVGGCCVCADESGWHENPLVYCDGCDLAVHQGCYGIIKVPDGNWYCSKCVDLHRPVPDAQCKLCPLPYGALKRTQDNGWAHVICALYIPEIKFGDVNSMDPVITSEVPLDSFSRVCYICQDNGRVEASKSGVCVRCHRDNCKKFFHVTCAQWSGLLCEEHGGQKCVRYIGFCSYHHKRVAATDPNIKLIPAYKPSNYNPLPAVQPNNDSKLNLMKSESRKKQNGPHRPPSSDIRPSSTLDTRPPSTLDTRPPSTLDTRPPSTASTHSLVSLNPARPHSECRPSSTSNSWDITRIGSLPPPKQNGPSTLIKGGWVDPGTSSITPLPPTTGALLLSNQVPRSSPPVVNKFTAISPPPPTQKGARTGAVPAVSPAPIMPGVFDAASGVSANNATTSNHQVKLPPPPQFTSVPPPKPHGRPPGTGKRGRPPNHSIDPNATGPGRPPNKRPRKNQSKKTVKCLLEEVSQVVDDTVQSFQRERELSHQQQSAITPSTSNHQSIIHPITPEQQTPYAHTLPPGGGMDLRGVVGYPLPPHVPSDHSNFDAPLPTFASLADGVQASTSGLGPVRPVPMLGTLTSEQGSTAFAGTLEQLLERQWEQGSQFLMDQAKHFDVASMLSCLHSLKEENNRMDSDICGLTTRRDHLLAVNARLGVTLGAQQLISAQSPNRLITSHSANNIHAHQSTDSSPSSIVAPYRAPSTISPASHSSNSKSVFAQTGSALVSPLATVCSTPSNQSQLQVLPANQSYGAFTTVQASRTTTNSLPNSQPIKQQAADLAPERTNCVSSAVSAGFLMPRAPEALLSAAGAFNSQLSQLTTQLTQEQLMYLMSAQQAYGGLGLVQPGSPHRTLLSTTLIPPNNNTNNINKQT